MDLFEKIKPNPIVAEAKKKGIYPYFHCLESKQDIAVTMEGKRRIMLGSNNYLGLTSDPEVIEASIKAVEKYGTGCSGSRFLNGTLDLHLQLESELADFLHKEINRLIGNLRTTSKIKPFLLSVKRRRPIDHSLPNLSSILCTPSTNVPHVRHIRHEHHPRNAPDRFRLTTSHFCRMHRAASGKHRKKK